MSTDGNARLTATLTKSNVTEKVKNLQRAKSIILDKSIHSNAGIGTTTVNNGLKYGTYQYGTRVQDEEICLNVLVVFVVPFCEVALVSVVALTCFWGGITLL